MISRIYVMPKKIENKADSYLIDSKLSKKELQKLAEALANPILENYYIDSFPTKELSLKFSYAIEIGFLPGVTDNVGQTVKEIATDLFHLKKSSDFHVYTSKILFVESNKLADAQKIAMTLHNPLIERAFIAKVENKSMSLPMKAPKVVLEKKKPVINVLFEVEDEELIKIGREGIMDENGGRRGPLALDLDSMKVIKTHFEKLKRNPTDIELESLAQTWSEHCKHTIFANPIDDIKDGLYKTYIKGATNLIREKKGKKDFCVSVFSDNSGGIVFDDDYLITHKVETHNSPSALDPFGGAITGIVGVNRDTIGFGLGAKPVANVYGFCFGFPDDERKFFRDKNLTQPMLSSRRIIDGVIKGINVGGNCSGIPTLSGFVKFDDRYRGKPLVFAGTVGLIPRKLNGREMHEKRARAGDYIVVVGGRVGKDGIHGATFSSVVMDSNSPATAVQIGDPITQKKLSDAIVKEARDLDLYNSITDNGAGGLSCSVAEMAKECGGAKVFLDKAPLKYPGLQPWEIWISESQERMTLSVPKGKWGKFQKLMESRGVEATVIGEFTNSGKCIVEWKGKVIMNIDLEFLHNGLPKHNLITSSVMQTPPNPPLIKGRAKGEMYTKIFENLLADKNISGFSFISEQYDHEVQGSSVLKPLSGPGKINTDAQVFCPVLNSKKGVVLSSGICPSYGDVSTYHMATCALDTAVRNAIACGGTLSHLAILDNFCWCSSNDQKRLAQLVESVKACYDGAVSYGTPFISGKDSMFNDFKGYDEKGNPVAISIPPTLLISAISVMPDIYKTVSPEFKNSGDAIYLLGETHDELGVPKVDFEKNLKTYLALEKAIQKELVASSISITSGGFAVALAKACVGGMLGCKVSLNQIALKALSVETKLFSESQGRILVSVSLKKTKQFEKLCASVAFTKLGKTNKSPARNALHNNAGGGRITIMDGKDKIVETNVKKLHKIYHNFSDEMK
ncbi:MAG: AIR synthase-related protein [Candidatus Nomurabacteria bacterium]|nr:AIR synthase-related protein [Candidatus Nomurabacteria bacterium]